MFKVNIEGFDDLINDLSELGDYISENREIEVTIADGEYTTSLSGTAKDVLEEGVLEIVKKELR